METFEEMYGKSGSDLDGLKLEEKHLQGDPVKCVAIPPRETLSELDPSQTLIIVLGKLVPTVCLNQIVRFSYSR
jgi:hypothetical protein